MGRSSSSPLEGNEGSRKVGRNFKKKKADTNVIHNKTVRWPRGKLPINSNLYIKVKCCRIIACNNVRFFTRFIHHPLPSAGSR